jgi:16S rRNA (guanine527-N7)-methyltransferase
MDENIVIKVLKNELEFTNSSVDKLKKFHNYLLEYNKNYNLISRSTEKSIWFRHILDSAQILKFINKKDQVNIADFGSGAGFPGIIIAIFGEKNKFHVKLYEKSPVKRDFLNKIKKTLNLDNLYVFNNVYDEEIICDVLVCRAFKKIEEILKISRENVKKPHKLIILKGKNAQEDINKVSLSKNYSYKLENSITSDDSKIIILEAK